MPLQASSCSQANPLLTLPFVLLAPSRHFPPLMRHPTHLAGAACCCERPCHLTNTQSSQQGCRAGRSVRIPFIVPLLQGRSGDRAYRAFCELAGADPAAGGRGHTSARAGRQRMKTRVLSLCCALAWSVSWCRACSSCLVRWGATHLVYRAGAGSPSMAATCAVTCWAGVCHARVRRVGYGRTCFRPTNGGRITSIPYVT